MDNTTKNLTVTLALKEHELLDKLVEYFQDESIGTVSKSDVIKFLIKNYLYIIEHTDNEDVKKLERTLRQISK